MQNCHFCNTNFAGIKLDDLGGWFCPSDICGQYNGFDESGDYLLNHDDIFNVNRNSNIHRSCRRRRVARGSSTSLENVPQVLHNVASHVELCNTCQQKEYNKLQILNGYNPSPQTSYYTIEKFKRQLDKQYPLCRYCQRQNLTLKLPLINQKFSIFF